MLTSVYEHRISQVNAFLYMDYVIHETVIHQPFPYVNRAGAFYSTTIQIHNWVLTFHSKRRGSIFDNPKLKRLIQRSLT